MQPATILAWLFSVVICGSVHAQERPMPTAKICGMSLESPPRPISKSDMVGVHASGSNWVAIIPYGYSSDSDPLVYFNSNFQWWGERIDGTIQLIILAKEAGFNVMLKPQVWMQRSWIGDFDAGSEADWLKWEESYREYALTYAALAQKHNVGIYCIGTEYKTATAQRDKFWKSLIAEIRKIYSGKITYAANWDEYEQIGFWDEVDYIGIDAYFPLMKDDEPLIAELTAAWMPIKERMRQLSKTHQKPILLTEYGYRSTSGAAGNHWELDGKQVNPNAQRKAYLALYDALWHQEWVAGGFAWKWHFKTDAGGLNNSHYTPQGKPALDVIKSVYRITLE